jgi:myo-inositol-1(or 4)-monophosphatase
MTLAPEAQEADWLEASRRATDALREILNNAPTTAERVRETGTRGEGGDSTLLIDAAAEDAVFAELDRLHAEGHRFSAVSEERGVVDYGGAGGLPLVIIDPIDGSLNAKRRIPHHSISIAVADGRTMADVVFGYVYDFGPDEEWVAYRGAGATLDGVALPTEPAERRTRDGLIELLGIESADPRWIAQAAGVLEETTHRVRAMGTIAVTLCQVAAARFDAMATLKGCRAVDAAAGQLIVREAGGHVAFTRYRDPLGAPLDLEPHSALVAARTERGLAEASRVPQMPRA